MLSKLDGTTTVLTKSQIKQCQKLLKKAMIIKTRVATIGGYRPRQKQLRYGILQLLADLKALPYVPTKEALTMGLETIHQTMTPIETEIQVNSDSISHNDLAELIKFTGSLRKSLSRLQSTLEKKT